MALRVHHQKVCERWKGGFESEDYEESTNRHSFEVDEIYKELTKFQVEWMRIGNKSRDGSCGKRQGYSRCKI